MLSESEVFAGHWSEVADLSVPLHLLMHFEAGSSNG